MDTWAIGVAAWEVLRSTPWASVHDQQLVRTHVQYFGGPPLAKVYQHHTLFGLPEHRGEKTKIF